MLKLDLITEIYLNGGFFESNVTTRISTQNALNVIVTPPVMSPL